jgi:phosphopantothenoylcysteine synthetase/decarboxylase
VHGIPKIIAPAMNTRMYENPVVQENLQKLKSRDWQIIEPREARLACGYVGKGALAEKKVIIQAVQNALGHGA